MYENLYEKAYKNKLDPLVSEFENYLLNFWDNSNLSIQRNLNYDENKSNFISFKRAREKYKLSEGNLDKLLSTGYINYRKVNKNILINKQNLERFLELEMFNLREVAQYLNVDQKVIADFESAGFFKLMRGSKIDGHPSNRYLREDVIQFIESIEKNISYLPKGELTKDLVSLKNIYRHLKGGFRLSDIIVFIMEGHIRPYSIVGESEKGLNRFLINTRELDDFCYYYKIKNEFGTFSLSEISKFLEIPYPFIERIVNNYNLIERNGKNSSVLVVL
ncbi:hypothetical protein [Bacillus sp. V33-4]|uniref:hypothetical protein n=1 Tax=Bacillus sp. V33-4 TaxID=2054169 RepID=UPI00115AF8E6|nr:hypothetical protein [Bacillus sp. V33-4]